MKHFTTHRENYNENLLLNTNKNNMQVNSLENIKHI